MTRRLLRLHGRAPLLALALLGAASLGGCDRQTSAAQLEIAGELRALRLALAARQPDAAAAPAAIERSEISAALTPLRDVLDGLGAAQRELAARQATLTQELGRWTQLLVATTSEQRAAEARDLTARLAQLEESMAAQDVRHREVEALLQGALDRTADRLEDFLQRLRREPAPAPSATPKPVDASAPRNEAGGGDAGGGAPPPATTARGEQGAIDWLWYALLPFALVSSALVARQLWQPRAAAPALDRRAEAEPNAAPGLPSVGEAAGAADAEVRELWAAAALLGEAVGKLRQSGPAGGAPATREGAPEDESAEPAPPADLDLDDLFVIDDDDEPTAMPEPESPAADLAAPTAPRAPAGGGAAPPLCSVHVAAGRDPAAAQARLLDLLHADPRILLEPAPRLEPAADGWRVAFGVLPGLPPGERSLLEQRLRDAVA